MKLMNLLHRDITPTSIIFQMSTPVNLTVDDGYKSDSRSQTVMESITVENKSDENTVSEKVKQYNDMLRMKTGKVLEIDVTPNDVVLMKVSFILRFISYIIS